MEDISTQQLPLLSSGESSRGETQTPGSKPVMPSASETSAPVSTDPTTTQKKERKIRVDDEPPKPEPSLPEWERAHVLAALTEAPEEKKSYHPTPWVSFDGAMAYQSIFNIQITPPIASPLP